MKQLFLALTFSLLAIGNGECKTLPQLTKDTPVKIEYKDQNGTLNTRSGLVVDHTVDSVTILQNSNQAIRLASNTILTILFLEDDIVVRFDCIEDFFTVLAVLFNPEEAFQVEQSIPTQTDTYTQQDRIKPFKPSPGPSRFRPKRRSKSKSYSDFGSFHTSKKKFSFKLW